MDNFPITAAGKVAATHGTLAMTLFLPGSTQKSKAQQQDEVEAFDIALEESGLAPTMPPSEVVSA